MRNKFFKIWWIWVNFISQKILSISQNHIFQGEIWQNFASKRNIDATKFRKDEVTIIQFITGGTTGEKPTPCEYSSKYETKMFDWTTSWITHLTWCMNIPQTPGPNENYMILLSLSLSPLWGGVRDTLNFCACFQSCLYASKSVMICV